MDSIFEAIGVAAIPYFVIRWLLRWQKTSDQEKSLQWHSKKLAEYAARIKELEATIASLNLEIDAKDRRIAEQDREYLDLCEERTSFPEYIQDLFAQAGEDSDLEDLLEQAHTLYVEMEEKLEKKDQEIRNLEKMWADDEESYTKEMEETEKKYQAEIAWLRKQLEQKNQSIQRLSKSNDLYLRMFQSSSELVKRLREEKS
mgnify:CR=1 FL=1